MGLKSALSKPKAKRGASAAEYCIQNARKVTYAAEYSAEWRIFIEIFKEKACDAICKDRFLYFHMAYIHRKPVWHDL